MRCMAWPGGHGASSTSFGKRPDRPVRPSHLRGRRPAARFTSRSPAVARKGLTVNSVSPATSKPRVMPCGCDPLGIVEMCVGRLRQPHEIAAWFRSGRGGAGTYGANPATAACTLGSDPAPPPATRSGALRPRLGHASSAEALAYCPPCHADLARPCPGWEAGEFRGAVHRWRCPGAHTAARFARVEPRRASISPTRRLGLVLARIVQQ